PPCTGSGGHWDPDPPTFAEVATVESRRLSARLAALALEAVLCFGVLGCTWLVMDELLGDGWAPRLVRASVEGGRDLAEGVGIVEERRGVVIPDPPPERRMD
ncbi:MAG TPA: hypothetical protein VKB01_07600, partial [Thermomicrobiales bacterium]|nr:hypothetical protein [Thermomicrobiales bacterium]